MTNGRRSGTDVPRTEQPPPGKKACGGGGSGGDGGGGNSTSKSGSIGKMFFKTKLCSEFRAGTCPYIANCNFAHGMEELRKPPGKQRRWWGRQRSGQQQHKQEIVVAHEGSMEQWKDHQIPIMIHDLRAYKDCPPSRAAPMQCKARESVTVSPSPTVGG
ncbi:hypothetical protein HU200_028756 [Digitaria exilis]|uniref:C3H1-type domain-containing protein n=1 Tax=Digitaria exilis TaxID=1010633 RepID=A0A835BV03_9POAL|nr:hypothetical protein HU200_028756 [Digitaria exilis]